MVEDRPRYHFRPAKNWVNDPNGLIQWRGVYHLFYQYNPQGPFHGTIHWGHACSVDLVHWTVQPLALVPTPGSPDEAGCWSGCAVDHDGIPTLIYTGLSQVQATGLGRQAQCLATSVDGLRTWVKHPANPVIAAPPPSLEVIGFRDPSVWREGDGWTCVIGSGIVGAGGAILLYRSPDLVHWRFDGVLCTSDAPAMREIWTGSMWECPQFFPLGDRYVLIWSVWDNHKTHHTLYAVGEYDGSRFTPQIVQRLDLGSALYAPAVLHDAQGRRLMWGWLREARRKAAVAAAGWSGMQSLPRVLSLGEDHTLRMVPAPELTALRGAHRHWEHLTLDDAAPPFSFPGVQGDALELHLIVDLDASSAGAIELQVRRSPDAAEYTAIVFDRASGYLGVNRDHASLASTSYCGEDGGAVDVAPDEPLRLHIFLDRSVLEVYANDRACLSERIYPTRPDSVGLSLVARSGAARVHSLDVWDLGLADKVVEDGGDH
jgi:beta-fructofuranosidase